MWWNSFRVTTVRRSRITLAIWIWGRLYGQFITIAYQRQTILSISIVHQPQTPGASTIKIPVVMSTRTPFPHQSVQSSNLALRNSTEMTYSSVCLHGKTSNGNESFNNVLWRIALKSEFSGLTTLKLSVYTAVLLYNNGASGILNVLSEQGLKVGTFGMLGAERRARARVSIANYQDKPQVKSRRHTLKKRRSA